jgi:lysophospholipase L1-like esterase
VTSCRTALFIGDSYTQGYKASSSAARWSTVLAAREGWTEENYAVGGSGFTVGGEFGRTFLAQAQLAHANGVTPDVIVVAGGRNDYTTNVIAAAHTFTDYIEATWPAARLVAVPGLWDANSPIDDPRSPAHPAYVLDRVWDWRTVFLARNVEMIGHAWSWLFGRPEWVDGDQTHPNDVGYSVIANYITQGLNGHDTRVQTGRFTIAPAQGWWNTDLYGEVIDGTFHLFGGLSKGTGSVAYLDQVATVPAWCAPGATRYVPVFTAGGNSPLLAKVTPNGQIQIVTANGTLTRALLFPALSWPVGQ